MFQTLAEEVLKILTNEWWGWGRRGGGAVCNDRKQAGWAKMGRIQELILARAFFFKVKNGFKIITPSESSKTGEKAPNMHTPVRR